MSLTIGSETPDLAGDVIEEMILSLKRSRTGRCSLTDREETVTSGQLWLIDLPATARELSSLEKQAIAAANITIYDRALAAIVAGALPLGGYAEPASDAPPYEAAARCVRFARDGWTVVRLCRHRTAQGGREKEIQLFAERLAAAGAPAELPVTVIVPGSDGSHERIDGDLGALRSLLHAHIDAGRVTIIFAPFGTGVGPRAWAVMANGLAG